MKLSLFVGGILLFRVVSCYLCPFIEETIAVQQPDGSTVCVCDRSKGYIGPSEDACSFVRCPPDMEPDNRANCQCIDGYYLKDDNCIEKSRCKIDEVIIHNGSRYDDRKCVSKNTEVTIRDSPLVSIEDRQATSISIKVYRTSNETGPQNVSLTVNLVDGHVKQQQQRVVTTSIGEARLSVRVTIAELLPNSSYRLEVTTSNDGITSNPAKFVVKTLQQMLAREAPLVTVMEVNQTACILEITPDENVDTGKICLTFCNLTDNSKGYIEKEIEREDTVTKMNVVGLVADTSYQIVVKTDDIAGGSDTRQIIIQTPAYVIPKQTPDGNQTMVIVIAVCAAFVIFTVTTIVIVKFKGRNRRNHHEDITAVEETGDGSNGHPLEESFLAVDETANENNEEAEDETEIKNNVEDPIVCHPEED